MIRCLPVDRQRHSNTSDFLTLGVVPALQNPLCEWFIRVKETPMQDSAVSSTGKRLPVGVRFDANFFQG
ncbi:hypothetical protein HG66A1_26380 [Gimesia chilikensis]|uniref:Uncharacterized protein n=1 Tax=Gimesia chilikensis TaxID=2605989 RepID=A0A517PNB9_9PLAN|nr:hypothetical protein HG66A1_26380 [Gimesia chilikensis]